jgi:hypothetical protein
MIKTSMDSNSAQVREAESPFPLHAFRRVPRSRRDILCIVGMAGRLLGFGFARHDCGSMTEHNVLGNADRRRRVLLPVPVHVRMQNDQQQGGCGVWVSPV